MATPNITLLLLTVLFLTFWSRRANLFFWLGVLLLTKPQFQTCHYVLEDENGAGLPDKAFEAWLRKVFGTIPEADLAFIFGAAASSLGSHSIRKVFCSIDIASL